jgi:prepilin-type N-terminal cleavage/methylation domain-containing protein
MKNHIKLSNRSAANQDACREPSRVGNRAAALRRAGSRECAFTLIEMLLVIAIIVVCVGLLLPAVQDLRDEANKNAAISYLKQIASKEHTFFNANQVFTDMAGLGMEAEHQGYMFSITFQNDDHKRFRALGTPVAPGLTGRMDCGIDAAGNLGMGPTPGAAAARRMVFDNINMQSAEVLAELISKIPDKFALVASTVNAHTTVATVFHDLDANHDGLVTFSELLSANLGSVTDAVPVASQWLPYIDQQLSLGIGGEILGNLPGITLPYLGTNSAGPPPLVGNGILNSPWGSNNPAPAQWQISNGVSWLILSNATPATFLPAVQLTGHAQGTIGSTTSSGTRSSGTALSLVNASCQLLLVRVDESVDATGRTWWGTSSLVNGDGSELNGIVLGVFGSNAAPATVAEPITPVLHCLVITPQGTGWFDRSRGHGTAAIDWGDSFGDRFSGSFSVHGWDVGSNTGNND